MQRWYANYCDASGNPNQRAARITGMTMSMGARATGRERVAVIGSGVSGLTAAYLLRRRYDVTLFEGARRLGGHAHTHSVPGDGGRVTPVDSGFIVHNDRTYPQLRRLFGELGVPTTPTEMSMSIACQGCGLEYAGGRGAKGVLAQPSAVLRPQFARLLLQVPRFHRAAISYLQESAEDNVQPYGEWLRSRGFSAYFINHYAIPIVTCVWSSGHGSALQYPARYLFEFLRHHGMLSLSGSPQWRTVVGGSQVYVQKIADLLPDVRVGDDVRGISRGERVRVHHASGTTEVDRVVIATHADEALALLESPSEDERRVLGAFGYTPNKTVLHGDLRMLPRARQAQASWNYSMSSCHGEDELPTVTYWMNKLQHLPEARPFLVTLNPSDSWSRQDEIETMVYTHPIYTPDSVRAQRELPSLNSSQVAFAGAYHGWGFHEDGARSGVEAARHFGAGW